MPQSQINFSPDGRLLASMGIDGNAIKLWETASGRSVAPDRDRRLCYGHKLHVAAFQI